MKVYVVTSGEYSSYHIDAIFTNEEIANQYANLDSDRTVEIYETDIESVEADPNNLVYSVHYNFDKNKIVSLCLTSGYNKDDDMVNDITLDEFYFYVSPSETLNKDIRMWGMNSDWLLKIAQDRFYMYCDKHETSLGELLQQKKKRLKEFEERYPMYRTSADCLFNPYFYADAKCTEIMDNMIKNGVQLPTGEELRETYKQIVKKVKEEHEQDELH